MAQGGCLEEDKSFNQGCRGAVEARTSCSQWKERRLGSSGMRRIPKGMWISGIVHLSLPGQGLQWKHPWIWSLGALRKHALNARVPQGHCCRTFHGSWVVGVKRLRPVPSPARLRAPCHHRQDLGFPALTLETWLTVEPWAGDLTSLGVNGMKPTGLAM